MKCPEFQAERVGNSLYLNQTGNRTVPIKVSRAMRKSMKRLPGDINARWVYLNGFPALLGKGKAEAVILSGEYRLLKAKQEKDLAYWKKKLLAALSAGLQKSLGDILYPEGPPEDAEALLLKARGFPAGTIRTWGGKEYKKMASGKWVRTYKEEESRGAKQAIRNVKKKIENAKSMAELLEIVKENQSRFQDSKGRMLPIVKEFMVAARATQSGAKKVESLTTQKIKDRLVLNDTNPDGFFSLMKEKGLDIESMKYEAIDKEIRQYIKDEAFREIREKEEAVKEEARKDVSELKKQWEKESVTSERDDANSGALEDLEKLESMVEAAGGKEAVRNALLKIRKEDVSLSDLGGEKRTDLAMQGLIASTGLSEDEILEYLGIENKRGRDKKKRQKRADKGVEKNLVKNMDEDYDPTLDPNSPEYRFKDTGYIAGSRKEMAAESIKVSKKEGKTVRKREVDWAAIEENPRNARELIVKSNLFGAVDWEELKKGGMEPAAGFLIDRVYASIQKQPEDNPLARQDYTYGIESVRERLERCKTADDVTKALSEMREEYTGEILSAEATDEVVPINERLMEMNKISKEKRAIADEMYRSMRNLEYEANTLKYEIANRERRGWKPKPGLAKQEASARKKAEAAAEEWRDYLHNNPESTIGGRDGSEFQKEYRELRRKRRAIIDANIQKNLLSNPFTRAWSQMGKRFIGVLNYRFTSGSKSFQKHVADMKYRGLEDWSWAEGQSTRGRKVSEKTRKFQIKVAEKYERIGGKKVDVSSTQALKDRYKLREVQSGNWVLKDPASAKFHVERTAESFTDLSDIVGIPEDKLSFNGRVAMAFGARGRGNAGFGGAAKAHYESVERVINLTKMGGGGSLAHEWFHSLDNLLSEASTGDQVTAGDFATEDPTMIRDDDVRNAFSELTAAMNSGESKTYRKINYTPEDYRAAKRLEGRSYGVIAPLITGADSLESASIAINEIYDKHIKAYEDTIKNPTEISEYGLKRVKSSLRKAKKSKDSWLTIAAAKFGEEGGGSGRVVSGEGVSEFYKHARDLDNGKDNHYWSRTKEMAARAFAAYVEDKMGEQGRKNDYLAVYSDNKYYRDPLLGNTYPYPEGEERERINAAFDKLFSAINNTDAIRKAMEDEVG
jgi:hypothetical protein